MTVWNEYLERGRLYLYSNKNSLAFKVLYQAVAACPARNGREIEIILFYMGLAALHLPCVDLALRCWRLGIIIDSNSRCKLMFNRYSNRYGMQRQFDGEADDAEAFKAIQLLRYLNGKTRHCFCSDAEKEMICQLIEESWQELLLVTDIGGMNVEEKLTFFNKWPIVFPYGSLESLKRSRQEERTIPFDFRKNRLLAPTTSCFCNSGLPYLHCCGSLLRKNEQFLYNYVP